MAVDTIRDLAQQAQSLKDKVDGKDAAGAVSPIGDGFSATDTPARRLTALAAAQAALKAGADRNAPTQPSPTPSTPRTVETDSVVVTLGSSFDGWILTHGNEPSSKSGADAEQIMYLPKWNGEAADVASTIRDGRIDRGALFATAFGYESTSRCALAGLPRTGTAVNVFGSGSATIAGGSGNDAISGSVDGVFIDGGAGDDIVWTSRDAVVFGGDGDDAIVGLERLTASGGDGNDEISGYDGVALDGGDGDDHLSGRNNSWLAGGAGNDLLSAYDDSVVDGGAGDDAIWVKNNSRVEGGAGDDVVYAMDGTHIDAGVGNDVVSARQQSEVRGGTGDDDIAVGANSTVHFSRGDGMDRLTLTADSRGWTGRSAAKGKADGVTVTFDDLSIKDLEISTEGDDIRLSFGNGDGILLIGAVSGAAPSLRFKDGAIDANDLQKRDLIV